MFSHTRLSRSLAGLSRTFLLTITDYVEVRTPECTHSGLGSSHFARRYFGNRCFFLFLSLLRCFSSGGSPSYVMDWRMSTWSLSMWVSPFRNLRIKGYLLLPEAFRSLSRLSSALSARASTPRSLKLNQTSHPAGTGFDSRRIALRPLVHGFCNNPGKPEPLPLDTYIRMFLVLGCPDQVSFETYQFNISSVCSFQSTMLIHSKLRINGLK